MGLWSGLASAVPAIKSISLDYSVTPNVVTISGATLCRLATCATAPAVTINGAAQTLLAGFTTNQLKAAWTPPAPGSYTVVVTNTTGSMTATVTAGAVGPVDPTGLQGPAGAVGATGAQGLAGDPGLAGAPGLPGAAGTNGTNGATGPVGPAGNTSVVTSMSYSNSPLSSTPITICEITSVACNHNPIGNKFVFAGGKIWMRTYDASYNHIQVTSIDPTTGGITDYSTGATGATYYITALASDGTNIWVAYDNYTQNNVFIDSNVVKLDSTNGEILRTYSGAPSADGGAIQFDGTSVLIFSNLALQKLDPSTGVWSGAITGNFYSYSNSCDSLALDGSNVWSVGSNPFFQKININTGNVIDTYLVSNLQPGRPLQCLRVIGADVWLGAQLQAAIIKFDSTTGASASIGLSHSVNSIAFDGTHVWATGESNLVSKIDPVTESVSTTQYNLSPGEFISFYSLAFDGTTMWPYARHYVQGVDSYVIVRL